MQTIDELNELKAKIIKEYNLINDYLKEQEAVIDNFTKKINDNKDLLKDGNYKTAGKNILDMRNPILKVKHEIITKIDNFIELKPKYIYYEFLQTHPDEPQQSPTPYENIINLNNELTMLEEFDKIEKLYENLIQNSELYTKFKELKQLYITFQDENCKNTSKENCSFFSDENCYIHGDKEKEASCIPNTDDIFYDLKDIPHSTAVPYLDSCIKENYVSDIDLNMMGGRSRYQENIIKLVQPTRIPDSEHFTNITKPPCGNCNDPHDCFDKNEDWCGKNLTNDYYNYISHITYNINTGLDDSIDIYFKNYPNYRSFNIYVYNKFDEWEWHSDFDLYELKRLNDEKRDSYLNNREVNKMEEQIYTVSDKINQIVDYLQYESPDAEYFKQNPLRRMPLNLRGGSAVGQEPPMDVLFSVSEPLLTPKPMSNLSDETKQFLKQLADLEVELETIEQLNNLEMHRSTIKEQKLSNLDYKLPIDTSNMNFNQNKSLVAVTYRVQDDEASIFQYKYVIIDISNQKIISVDKSNNECDPKNAIQYPLKNEIIDKFLPIFNSINNYQDSNLNNNITNIDNSNEFEVEEYLETNFEDDLNNFIFGKNQNLQKQCKINFSDDVSIPFIDDPNHFGLKQKLPIIGNSNSLGKLSEDCCSAILDYCNDDEQKLAIDKNKCDFYKDTCNINDGCLIPSIVNNNKKCNINMCDKFTKLLTDFNQQTNPFIDKLIINKKCALEKFKLDEFKQNLDDYTKNDYNDYIINVFHKQDIFKELSNLFCSDPNKTIVPNNIITTKYMNLICKGVNGGINNQSPFDSKLPDDYETCGSHKLKYNPPKLTNQLTSMCDEHDFPIHTSETETGTGTGSGTDSGTGLNAEMVKAHLKNIVGNYKPQKSNINTKIPHANISKDCNKLLVNSLECENRFCKKNNIKNKTDYIKNKNAIEEQVSELDKCESYHMLNSKCDIMDPNVKTKVNNFFKKLEKLKKKEKNFTDKEIDQLRWLKNNHKCYKFNKYYKDPNRFLTKKIY